VILDCVATLAGASGKQLLRHAAVTKNNWFIPLGLVCTAVIDPMFDISAYAFAAQSVIAPMAGMVVVWNVLLAPFTLGEVLTPTRKRGAILIILGTACSGFFGNHMAHEKSVDEYLETFARTEAIIYYLGFAAVSGVCVYYLRYGSQFAKGFTAAAWGGLLAGNMMTTKASVEMIKCVFLNMGDDAEAVAARQQAGCETNPFFTPYPYLFISTSLALACGALYLLAVGLRSFEALYMITVFEGFMVISGAISGNVVLNEAEGWPALSMAFYSGFIGVILVGLYVITNGEQQSLQNAEDNLQLAEHDGERQRSGSVGQIDTAEMASPQDGGEELRSSSPSKRSC